MESKEPKTNSPKMLYLEQREKDTPIQDQFNAWQDECNKKVPRIQIGLLKEPEVTITTIETAPGKYETVRSCTVRYMEMSPDEMKIQMGGGPPQG